VALEERYYCWDGRNQQLMMDYLSSPAHSLKTPTPPSISISTNTSTTILAGRADVADNQPDPSSILGQWAEPLNQAGSDGPQQVRADGCLPLSVADAAPAAATPGAVTGRSYCCGNTRGCHRKIVLLRQNPGLSQEDRTAASFQFPTSSSGKASAAEHC
jgi:hypothetical protein